MCSSDLVGTLGLNDTANRSSPVQIGSLSSWSNCFTGCSGTTLAIQNNGTLWSFGSNNSGELGQNNTANTSSPVQVGSDTNWSKVATGGETIYALKTNGTLWAWGRNNTQGRIGDGTIIDRSSPVQIGASTGWTDIGAGGGHGTGIESGKMYVWGLNEIGRAHV